MWSGAISIIIILYVSVHSEPRPIEVYSIQHYVINFVSDLRQVGVFLRVTPVSFTNKTDRHDITEILFKVPLNIITLTQKWTIQRNWQHKVHRTKKKKKHTTPKCVGHHCTQTNTNKRK